MPNLRLEITIECIDLEDATTESESGSGACYNAIFMLEDAVCRCGELVASFSLRDCRPTRKKGPGSVLFN